jgi:hypothetical protein
MAALKNKRHEAFAVEVAAMVPYAEAYTACGYARSRFSGPNGRKLAQKPAVAERIRELQAEHRARSADLLFWVQSQLIRIVDGRAADVPDRLAGIASRVVIGPDGKQTTTIDRVAALEWLLKSLGVGTANINIAANASIGTDVPPDLDSMSDLDIARRMAFLLAKAAPTDQGETLAYSNTINGCNMDATRDEKPLSHSDNFDDEQINNPRINEVEKAEAERHAVERQLSLDISGEPQQVAADPPVIRFAPLPPKATP